MRFLRTVSYFTVNLLNFQIGVRRHTLTHTVTHWTTHRNFSYRTSSQSIYPKCRDALYETLTCSLKTLDETEAAILLCINQSTSAISLLIMLLIKRSIVAPLVFKFAPFFKFYFIIDRACSLSFSLALSLSLSFSLLNRNIYLFF